ncbi:MAG: prepilin peptidase [Nevskia sp.]|nr:prepilin peptidase [Nevskia sp.]
MSPWTAGALAAWTLGLAYGDLRYRRIPNLALLVVAAPACMSMILCGQGLLGADYRQSLGGLALGGVPLLAGYRSGHVGAGDVKLAALQGFVLGADWMLRALLVAGLVLGAMALAAWLGRRPPGRVLPAGVALAVGFLCALAGRLLGAGTVF